MPHIIVEYAEQLIDDAKVDAMLQVILESFNVLKISASVITVEIIDMDRDSYGKLAAV